MVGDSSVFFPLKCQTVICGFFSCVHVCRVMCAFAGLSACVGVLLQMWMWIGGFLHICRSVGPDCTFAKCYVYSQIWACIFGFCCVFAGMIVYVQMWMQ